MARRPFYSVHSHSLCSSNDALSNIAVMAKRAEELGYPALGLTDHGRPTGNLQLYKACRRRGIEPLPGVELYVTPDREARIQGHNLHLTINAYTELGYKNLCRLVTQTAVQHHYKPRMDMADLAKLAEEGATAGLSVATGCWFGLLPTVMREQGPRAAEHVVKTLDAWFPRVYVELQAHGVEQEEMGEDEMVSALIQVSERTGVPYIITTDNHYVYPEEQPLHDGLKVLCSWSDDLDDAVFPGGPYSMMSGEDLKTYFEPKVIDRACDTLSDLADAASVRIPALDTFKMLVPDVSKSGNPGKELRELAMAGLAAKGRADSEADVQRVNHEVDITIQTGFDTYVLLIAGICDEMRRRGIVFCTRGSANDSQMCWAVGITNVDAGPQGWNLRFERFISIDRIKPPDVDLDIEHQRCEEILDWIGTQMMTCKIGTIRRYKLFDEDEDEGKGTLRVRYFSTARKAGRPIRDWRDVPPEDKKLLKDLSDRQLMDGYGTHPAGLILAPDAASIADLPMVHIGSGSKAHLVTAYDKNDVEDLGFIKGDFLGLRTLTAVAIASKLIMEDPDYQGDRTLTPMEFLETIPLNDKAVYKRFANMRTEGAFQLQEKPATYFVGRMKPRNIRELVAAMALMRPAARMSGTADTYLARRNKKVEIPAMHPDLAKETAKTYGTILFQEQVIGLCRTIGMDMPELNKILKAIKASNDYVTGAKEVIADALPRIIRLATERGWSTDDVRVLTDAIEGYGDYGFNEGHAVGYGQMSYRTGWLAEFWPVHWWTGILTAYANHDHESRYVTAARRYGIRIVPAHVNRSGVTYTLDRKSKAVRKGFLSVKGVGVVAAAELAAKAPYSSLADLAQRVIPKRVSGAKQLVLNKPLVECGGVIGSLFEVGALDGLE